MTDDRLAELFRAAAAAAPPPGFDHGDVVTESRRATARRRSVVGAFALLAVVGVGAVVALPDHSGNDPAATVAAPFAAPEGARMQQDQASAPGADAGAVEIPEALQGIPPFTGTPLGPGTAECADRQDPALRALVEQVLPEVTGAPEAAVTLECRPGGERGVNLEVTDAGATGLLSVVYLPPGRPVAPTASGASAVVATASGGTVTVSVRPTEPGAAVPFEGRLDTAAAFLAPRL